MEIVVVDYDTSSIENFNLCLKKMNETLLCNSFRSPVRAIEYIKEHPVDMMITEVRLPEMSGFTLANKVKGICPTIYTVILTKSEEYALEAWSRHIDDYLLKPVSIECLESSLWYMKNYSGRR